MTWFTVAGLFGIAGFVTAILGHLQPAIGCFVATAVVLFLATVFQKRETS